MSQNNILRDFAKYSSLSVLGMLAMSCYILADTFFVSQSLGTNGLAALNLAIPAYNFVHGVGLMLGMGGATRFSICKSRGEENEANIMFTNTVYLCLGFSVIFFLIDRPRGRQVFLWWSAPAAAGKSHHCGQRGPASRRC